MKRTLTVAVGIGLISLFLIAALVDLEGFPPLWWDEGWTLTVARNWVEKGFYGRFLAGERIPPGLEAAFPVTGLVGVSFYIFGVGIWQGRLVGVVCLFGTLGMMYFLALRLYNRRVAIGMLLVLFFMIPHPFLHPVSMGRQALAEVPMLFFLLSGYAFLSLAFGRSPYWLGAAIVFWGIGLNSKAQAPPFWAISLLIPLGFTLVRRQWKTAIVLTLGLLGTLFVYRLFQWGEQIFLQGHFQASPPIPGMLAVTALVFAPHSRWFAYQTVVEVGLPTLLGLSYGLWDWWRKEKRSNSSEKEILQLALLTLGGSWLAWYLFLSVAWVRYLFPPMMVGGLFVSVLLHDLTQGFRLTVIWARIMASGRNWGAIRQTGGVCVAAILILATIPSTAGFLYGYWENHPVSTLSAARQAADFLNARTPANALVETYESELHFLLDRWVHYPPDPLHVDLNRRTFLGEDVRIDYDPLAVNPDFLVVGPQARMWQLYIPVLKSGAFRPIARFGHYEIFERAR